MNHETERILGSGAHMKCALRFSAIFVLLVPVIAQEPATTPAQQTTHQAAQSQQPPSADKIWADLMEGNKRFIAAKPKTRQVVELRNKLAKGQHPNVVVLACSDSRV